MASNDSQETGMKRIVAVSLVVVMAAVSLTQAQVARHDKAVLVTPKNEFMDTVRKEAARFVAKPESPRQQIQLDVSGLYRPSSVNDFKKYWHNKPVSQAISGMCWCFSATSYFESEIYRLTKREIKLSELYTVYWEYVEKAKRFVAERGNSVFGEGSEANAVMRIWKEYGAVPADAYSGMKPGQKYHDHSKLFEEMNNYLQSMKVNNAWSEEAAVTTIKSILNHYLGEPPASVVAAGKSMTPKEYF
jgi:bleomycin hydrolase